MSDTSKPTIILRETVQRLLSDVRTIMKNPLTDNGIYYFHDDEDIMKGYAMIIGPSETPYYGGYYFFEIDYPHDYPFSPPKVTYKTNNGVTRFNPNLYKCGKVCVSILNTWSGEKWSACQSISTVLLTLCSLLNDKPFLNEPGQTIETSDFKTYQRTIEFVNIEFAICYMIMNIENDMPKYATMFFSVMKEHFIKNYDNYLSFIKDKLDDQPLPEIVFVALYGMRTKIDYEGCQKRLMDIKQWLDIKSW